MPFRRPWYREDGLWYYAQNRTLATNWLKVDDIWYYFSPDNGAMYADQWLDWTDGHRYWLKGSGAMAKDEILIIEGKSYLFDAFGQCANPNGE